MNLAERRFFHRTPASRQRRLVQRSMDGVFLVDDQNRRLLNFGSNDYLGLVMQPGPDLPSVASPSANTLRGSTSSSLVCGWSKEHQTLANEIADWEGTEAAVLFPSGYAACCGTIATLAEPNDLILSDQLNHASLIDGCRLSKATKAVFRHRDLDHVREILQSRRSQHAEAWIVSDSIFSMDGDVAPLEQLAELAEEFKAQLIVDEAHASGVFGETGTGMCEAMGVKEHVFLRIGTLSKALGSQGGFVTGTKAAVEHLINHCRMLIFSTALSQAAVRDAQQVLHHIRQHDFRRKHVRRLAQHFHERWNCTSISKPKIVRSPWADCSIEEEVPILPLILGDDDVALRVSNALLDAGFFVPAIRPPTVPEGTARLRVSLSAAHTEDQVDQLLKALPRAITHSTA